MGIKIMFSVDNTQIKMTMHENEHTHIMQIKLHILPTIPKQDTDLRPYLTDTQGQHPFN